MTDAASNTYGKQHRQTILQQTIKALININNQPNFLVNREIKTFRRYETQKEKLEHIINSDRWPAFFLYQRSGRQASYVKN